MPAQPHPTRRACAVVLTIACLLTAGAGCATGTAPSTGSTTEGAPIPASAPAPATTSSSAIPQTLSFTSATVGGGQFDGVSLAGKPAVLWFWAAWCPRCRAKASDVKTVQADYDGKVTFVGVAGLGSGNDAMAQFVTQLDLDGFTHLADDQGTVWRHFGVVEQEFFVLLDRAGNVAYEGPLSASDLRERVAALAG